MLVHPKIYDASVCSKYVKLKICLYCRKIRQKEASKFHIQLCIAMFFMLLFFLIGIDRTESEVGCTISSLLIQYFTMASVAWMGAEAVLMFHKLIIVFGHLHLVIISIVAWGKLSGMVLTFTISRLFSTCILLIKLLGTKTSCVE